MAIVGGGPEGYSAAMHGRSISLDRVQRWLVAWSATSYPQLRLVVTDSDAWVEVEGGEVFGARGPRSVQPAGS